MTTKQLASNIAEKVPDMAGNPQPENEEVIMGLILDYQNSVRREINEEIKRIERELPPKKTEPEWFERVYDYPSASWDCPRCQHSMEKRSLRWNYLLCENVCPTCGTPQRQFAIPIGGRVEAPQIKKQQWWNFWK
jgi:rubrerythrin